MKADALFNEGNALLLAKDYAGACAKFRESHGLDPAPGTAFNIGACEFNQGHFVESVRWYRTAVKLYGEGETRRDAQMKADDAATRVFTLTLRLAPTAPEGTAAELDGKPVSSQELLDSTFVEPGAHRLRVTAKGHQTRELTVEGKAGDKREITLTPGPAEAPPPAIAPPPKPSNNPLPVEAPWSAGAFVGQHKVSFSLLGAGVLLTGAAYGVGGDILGDRYSKFVQSCGSEAGCDQDQKRAIVERQIAANVLAGTAAAAGLAALGVFFFAEGGFEPRPKTAVSLAVGPGGARLTVNH